MTDCLFYIIFSLFYNVCKEKHAKQAVLLEKNTIFARF